MERLTLEFVDGKPFGRYAENWDQEGWILRNAQRYSGPDAATATRVAGPELGWNNYLDTNAGIDFITELLRGGYESPVVIIKHQKACGVATGEHAVERAYQGDPMNAFGGVWGFGRRFTLQDARIMSERPNGTSPKGKGWRRDVIFAPDFDGEAIDYVNQREAGKPNTRLLAVEGIFDPQAEFEYRPINGGVLIQKRDDRLYLTEDGKIDGLFQPAYDAPTPKGDETRRVGVVTTNMADSRLMGVADFAVRVCKQQPSNATVLCRQYAKSGFQLVGYGVAEPGRSDSARDATRRAEAFFEMEDRIRHDSAAAHEMAILQNELQAVRNCGDLLDAADLYGSKELRRHGAGATDSFFPFPDGLEELAKSGVTLILHPGGSTRDQEVIDAANRLLVSIVHTGKRYFKHTDSAGLSLPES